MDLSLSDEMIYEIHGSRVGCGGTKTAYLVSDDTVAFMPNKQDGQALVNMWPRIINEEIEMSKLLESIGIPSLKFDRCKVKMADDSLFSTYSAPSFASYVKDGNYIIDTKNSGSSQWPTDQSLNFFPENFKYDDFDTWIKILTPLLDDLNRLGDNGIYLSYDSLNLAFVTKGSSWHSGSELPFEVRIFGFDFASKRCLLDLSNRTPLSFSSVYRMLSKAIEYTLFDAVAPNQMGLTAEQNKLREQLTELCKTKLKTYDPKNPEPQKNDQCIVS